MNHDQIVTYLTAVFLPLLVLLVPLANRLMDRHEKGQSKKKTELELAQSDYEQLYTRHIALRETFERLKNDILRTLDIAILRLETGHQSERVVQVLESLKTRIESFALPGLDEGEKESSTHD